ncbi:MAG: GNAT family N-acetyltransferase [Sphingomonadaceae bacterium]|nr:GNAT family N-acetyltransferase [Sphingomonadaceae bacterium]
MSSEWVSLTDFDPQPTLAGALVRVRPLQAGDWEALFAVASDPLIWAIQPAHDRWHKPVFRRFFEDALGGGGALVVEDQSTGRAIGSSRYDLARVEPGEVEIGWTFLARSHRGGAANRDLKRLMIGHALAHFERCVFLVGPENWRSRRAMEKVGRRLLPRTHTTLGVRHVISAIGRDEFEAGPLGGAIPRS